MEINEDSYTKGEIVLYQEDNMVLSVEILENICDSINVSYKLKVIETLVPHYLFGKAKKGKEFSFRRLRGAENQVLGLSKIIAKTWRDF